MQPHNRLHIERQVFLIVPCANPDGTVRDIYHNARDVDVYLAYPQDAAPICAEAAAILEVVKHWAPDAYVDCHGLAGGGMGDGEYVHPTVNRDWSLRTLLEVTGDMDHAAGRWRA